jgi:hypothetical protein
LCLCEVLGMDDLDLAIREGKCNTDWLNVYTSRAKRDYAWDTTLDFLILVTRSFSTQPSAFASYIR